MAQIRFTNFDANPAHNLYWYINTSTGPQSGRLTGSQIDMTLPANALSIGWQSDAGQIRTYWDPYSKNYAYLVYSQPQDSPFAIPLDSSGEILGETAEGAAASMVQWKNNSRNSAEWAMYTSREVSGGVNAGAVETFPLPATRPLMLMWKVKAFNGRLLLNLRPPSGITSQLILEN
jgi:hypothetical protein